MEQKKRRTRRAKAQGLGDTVEKVLKVTGATKVVKFLMGEDCGCEERKAKLNKMFPYKKPLCLTEKEYTWLKSWMDAKHYAVTPIDQAVILQTYNRIFSARNEPTNCASCLIDMIEELKLILKTYEEDNN